MDLYKRLCLIEPDRWAGSFALGLRKTNPTTEIVCIADDDATEMCMSLGLASRAATSFREGLNGSDLILFGQRNLRPGSDFKNVVGACDRDATVCGHGRGVTAVGAILRELARDDVHYIGMEIGGLADSSADVSFANLADVRGQMISICPVTIDDLDALLKLQECLRRMNAHVSVVSPRIHDRQLAELVQLPKVILMPLVHYLVETLGGDMRRTIPDRDRLLEAISSLKWQDATAWAEDFSYNKHYLLAALEGYEKHLRELKQEFATGHIQNRLSLLQRQMAELSGITEPMELPVETNVPAAAEPTPESLIQIVDSLLLAVSHVEAAVPGDSSATGIRVVRKLVEQTRSALERLYLPNPLTQGLRQPTQVDFPPESLETTEWLHGRPSVPTRKDSPGTPPEMKWGGMTIASPEVMTPGESLAGGFEDVFVEPAPIPSVISVSEPEKSHEEMSFESFPVMTTEKPLPEPSPGTAVKSALKWDDLTYSELESKLQETTADAAFPWMPEERESEHSKSAATPPSAKASEPFAEWSEASTSVPKMPAHSQSAFFDLKIRYQPEHQVMQRTSHVLAAARITIRDVVQTVSSDGRKILCITLTNPNQRDRARQVLRQAGLPLE